MLLEEETLCLRDEVQQLEEDMYKAAHEHGSELLRVYETVARLEAALGEQGLEAQRLARELDASQRRHINAENNLMAHDSQSQDLRRHVAELIATWNKSGRAADAAPLNTTNLSAAVTSLREALAKEKAFSSGAAQGERKISPRSPSLRPGSGPGGGGGVSKATPSTLKGYIAELDSVGGALLSPAVGAQAAALR